MLNLKHLYYFWIFSHHLSMKEAAKFLKITSPALSNQLKRLEECVGVPLTQRKGKKVIITEAGEKVLFYSNHMFSAYEDLKIRLSMSEESVDTVFRVGISQFLGAQFAFDLLSLIFGSNLSLSKKVQITFGSSNKLIAGFKKDQFDLLLGSFAPEPHQESKWLFQTLTFPVRLFTRPHLMEGISPKDKGIALGNLSKLFELVNRKNFSLVLPNQPSIIRQETEIFFLNSRVTPARTIECNSSSGIIQIIERGFAIGFVPTPCLLDFKSADTLLVLGPPGGYWLHRISVIVKKGQGRLIPKISPLSEMFSPTAKFN